MCWRQFSLDYHQQSHHEVNLKVSQHLWQSRMFCSEASILFQDCSNWSQISESPSALMTSSNGLVWQTSYCHPLPCSRCFKLDCSLSPPCCPVCTCVQELEWTIRFTCSNSIFTVVAWCSNVEEMQIHKYRRKFREIHVITAVIWSCKRAATQAARSCKRAAT